MSDREAEGGPVRFIVFARSWSDACGALSRAEFDVARLAMGGANNGQIAVERGTRSSTVTRQLHIAYEKLGVSGRSELAKVMLDD